MSYHYTLNNFVRQASNDLLARYFVTQDIRLGISPATLKPRNFEPIVVAIGRLPDEVQARINRDFQRIDCLANEAGHRQIVAEARFLGLDLVEALAQQNSFLNKAFWAALNAPKVFDGAARLAVAFARGRYWKRGLPLPRIIGNFGAKVEDLAEAISSFFRSEEGRGKACKVEYLRRGVLHHFHAYPEDFAAAPLAWSNRRLAPHPLSPAFEVVFVFDAGAWALDVYFEGGKATAERLWVVFAQAVLGLSELPGVVKPSYRLDGLKTRQFPFVRPPDSPIIDVRVKRLGFALLGAKSTRLTIETDITDDSDALHDEIARVVRGPMAFAKVISATLRVTIDQRDGKRHAARSFDLSAKSCSLKYDGVDLLLRQMLRDSGIDQTVRSTAGSDGTPRQVA